jgi:RNA polymerase-binding transcription factor DksA
MSSHLSKQQQDKFAEMLSVQADKLCREAIALHHAAHAAVANGDTHTSSSVDGWIDLLYQYNDSHSFEIRRQLERIAAAQQQLDLGLYGLCSDCESPIAIERLEQDPSQQRCGICEARYNKLSASSKRVWL